MVRTLHLGWSWWGHQVGTSEVGQFGRWDTMGGGKTQWVAGRSLWVVALGGGGTPR